ncbi:chromosomal organization and DNA repair protein Mms21 [Stachybotrys elegans]|uniref:Chromosomal organization and DNA repair protein Mms21 n=1 Tax=Stachybotrys elegans TaxID=80388 RepID=A0A8K0SWB5_9HYPO|nr:chromosomal organization and DNA repair protein Mms21 [Stachybotrys elegans]
MSRRLLNRSGNPVVSSPSSSSTPRRTTTALPEYEPPSCPLDESARRALGELSNNRTAVPYELQLKESLRTLGSSVGDMHERLRYQRERLTRQKAAREAKGVAASTADEDRLKAHIDQLERDVEALTRDSERAVRELVDHKAELEDEVAVLGDLYTHAATQQPPPDEASLENENGDIEYPPVPSTLGAFRERRQGKLEEYGGMSMHQRYAVNNDYAGFKKLWHDAAVGEDGPPLPDASRWFRSDGQPVMSGIGDEMDGSDDDIAVAREVVSLKCPLTLRVMKEPYSNRNCKHTFEKGALLDYLPRQGAVQCPQTGCSQSFARADFDTDFHLNQAMLRRIHRAEAAHASDEDLDDDENLEGDSELAVRASNRRQSRQPKRERR